MRKVNFEVMMEDLRNLRTEPLSYHEHETIIRELTHMNDLQIRAEVIAEANTLDLDTAFDLAKAEKLIIENGFEVDLARILSSAESKEERTNLINGIQKEYGEGGERNGEPKHEKENRAYSKGNQCESF